MSAHGRVVAARVLAAAGAVFWGFLWFGVLTARPGAPVALAQLTVVSLAVVVGGLWAGALPQLWTGLGLGLTAAGLAWLGRGRLVDRRAPDPVLAVLAVVALPAAVAYGVPLARHTPFLPDITNGVSHDPLQASLALAVVGLVGLAAVTRSWLPAWTAAFSALWLGVESAVYPDLRASLGVAGGTLCVGWAALVCVAVARARRRTPAGAVRERVAGTR